MTTPTRSGSVPSWGSRSASLHFRGSSALRRPPARRARSRFAALVRGLPRAGRGRRALPGLLVEALLHQPAVLRTARHSVRLRSRPRHSLHGSERRPAGLPACARRGALRRHIAGTGACAQIWRPARPCADDGPLAVASRPRAFGRGGCAGAGAAALAAALGAALQPVGHSRRRRFQGERCRSPPARSSA